MPLKNLTNPKNLEKLKNVTRFFKTPGFLNTHPLVTTVTTVTSVSISAIGAARGARVPVIPQRLFFSKMSFPPSLMSFPPSQEANHKHIKSSNKNISLITLGAGALLFSIASAAVYAAAPSNPINPSATELEEGSAKLQHLTKELYPSCQKEMLEIYEAAGLTPLLQYHLSKAKPEEAIPVLNKLLQTIFLRPKNVERYQLEDESYLLLVQERLKAAYKEADLTLEPAALDAARLRTLLKQPVLWRESLGPDNKFGSALFDAAIIMGSTYQNYLNRQNYFLDLVLSHKINLVVDKDGKFPVYLLGGERPLNQKMDAPIIPVLKERSLTANEQNMMDVMFDHANKNLSISSNALRASNPSKTSNTVPLKRISTNSKNEAQGRPTTSGTVGSLMELLKNEKRVLVVSSAPFIRYQKLVTERQFLKQGLDIEVLAGGPDINVEMATHPELENKALVAICMDNLAREIYEMKLIAEIKQQNKNRKGLGR